jgi:hypothetical protein
MFIVLEMEDIRTIVPNLLTDKRILSKMSMSLDETRRLDYFAVFDGHSGIV